MEGVFCIYKFTTVKGYLSPCRSLQCRMTILNSNVLRKRFIQQSVVYLAMHLTWKPLPLGHSLKFTENLMFSCSPLVSHTWRHWSALVLNVTLVKCKVFLHSVLLWCCFSLIPQVDNSCLACMCIFFKPPGQKMWSTCGVPSPAFILLRVTKPVFFFFFPFVPRAEAESRIVVHPSSLASVGDCLLT